MNRCTLIFCHHTHIFWDCTLVDVHTRTHTHRYLSLLILVQTVYSKFTHTETHTNKSLSVTMAVAKIQLKSSWSLTKWLYNYCTIKSCILSKPASVSFQPGFAALQQLFTSNVPPSKTPLNTWRTFVMGIKQLFDSKKKDGLTAVVINNILTLQIRKNEFSSLSDLNKITLLQKKFC